MKPRLVGLVLVACAPPPLVSPDPVPVALALARAESLFAEVRTVKDQRDVAELRGLADSARAMRPAYLAARSAFVAGLAIDSTTLTDSVDRRALRTMRRVLFQELTDAPEPPASSIAIDSTACRYDPRAVRGTDSLEARLYACYGLAAGDVVVDGERYDRLTVFGLLGVTDDAVRRRRLFYGLDRVWRSVNGDNDSLSPWRELLRRRAEEWRTAGRPTPFARRVTELGMAPDTVRHWLVRLLETWRATLPDSAREPWDLYYGMGGASRRLSPRIPLDSLVAIGDRFYRDLGADPVALNLQYDLEPRAGKDPVAFTTFGARPGVQAGVWRPGAPYISSTYPIGGFDNLGQHLHELGHAIHIAGIRTRPAFADWPDADLFTEAIADLAGWEASEGRWQLRYLGDSAATADNRFAQFFGLAMDACWALFEDRMQQDPSLDPNAVWAELTHRYLRVVPHPELSWWGMRGQLIGAPSYLMNYALGAFITADVRDRIRALHGAFTLGDATWYDFVRDRIYRFGLERSSLAVMEEFLGRPLSADPLLARVGRR